jgi:signal transduction histidine kinase
MRGRTATIRSKPIIAAPESPTSPAVNTVHDALWPILDALELDEMTALVVFDMTGHRVDARGALADVLGCEATKLPPSFDAMLAPREATSWSMMAEAPTRFEILWSQHSAQSRFTIRTASRSWAVVCRWRALKIDQETIALVGIYKPAPAPLRSDLLARWPQTGMLRFDGRGVLSWLDDHARELLGLSPGLRLPLTEHVTLRAPDELLGQATTCPLHHLIQHGASSHKALLWLEDERGAKLINFDTRRVEGSGPGADFIASVQDVTDTYFHIQRREEFLSIASHELRSPLTPLRGFVQMALDAHRQGEEVVGLLERADGQVRRMAKMVDMLLDLSRVESGRMTQLRKPNDLVTLVRRAVASWPTSEIARRLQVSEEVSSLPVLGDEQALEQVLVNLIENAAKFSPPGTPIELRLSRHGQDAILRVEDHGPGMDARVRARVFDRFFQGPSARRSAGVGLGLYISRRIIEEHEGTIEVSGDNTHGTVVEIRLPMSA